MPDATPRISAVHFASLGLWLGALGMAGVTAAVLFPTMRELDPVLPAFGAYTGAHWSLAAGHGAAKVFAVSEFVQWAAGGLALATLVVSFLARKRAGIGIGVPGAIRAGMIAVAVGLTLYQAAVLGPRMDRNMHAYWDAARAGESETALAHKAAFDADHPRASRVLTQTFSAVAIALVIGCWSAGCAACARKPDEASP